MNTKFVPVGTIITFAGEVKDRYEELEKLGWLVCDGREFEQEKFPELFAQIKTTFGSQAEGLYNIPDLRGLFIRCISNDSGKDPDVAARVALMAGGASGNNIGSYQGYATASPKNDFHASIKNNSIAAMNLDAATDAGRSGEVGSSDTTAITDGTGGDLETRPKNKYVYYLIKISKLDKNNDNVLLPVGSIISFSGRPNGTIKQQYIRCEGQGISIAGQFQELYDAIKVSNGKPKNGYFNIPDYQGYFLRGVDSLAPGFRRDPEADQRTAPFAQRPEGEGGNMGDNVGSVQMDATAYPVTGSFSTTIPRLPSKQGSMAMDGLIKDTFDWNPNSQTVIVTETGGDTETRPINTSVDWYIKFI